jgi:periodic tryptophan protein 2
MKLSYRLTRICGNAFSNGNIVFTSDGNSCLSPVGNRISIFDLVNQTTTTLPFENRKNIRCLAVSHNGRFVISVDVDGHALFINLPRKVILTHFNFKRKVYDIKFSPNDEMFVVTFGHGSQIWKTPGVKKEFAPLVLCRTIGGFYDDSLCVDWSSDSGINKCYY